MAERNAGRVSSTSTDRPWVLLKVEEVQYPYRSSMGRAAVEGLERPTRKVAKAVAFQTLYGATPSEGARRRYEAHFISKLTDCDGENSETDTSLDFALDCHYITADEHKHLSDLCAEVGRMLGAMLLDPKPFLLFKQES